MFGNYLRVALRQLVRYKTYSLLNIAGLALGMACFFLIMGYVRFELSYDHYHQDADRICRIIRQVRYEPGGRIEERVNTGAPLLPFLEAELPGVECAARLSQGGGIVSAGDRRFVENRLFFADADIFQVLIIPLLQGDPEIALREPFSVVLTPETARRYFGEKDPLGQVLTYSQRDFKVTGILQEMPANSHLHADFLASFTSLETLHDPQFFENWDTRTWTYVKLRADHSPEEINRGLAVLTDKYVDKSSFDWVGLALQPLTSIHLNPGAGVEVEMGENRAPSSLYILSALAVVILLIACVNFMNLSTARSATRSREVGMRKVVGGHRAQLIAQFLGESILLSCISLGCSLVLVELLLPWFSNLVGKAVDFNYLKDPVLLLLMVGVAVVVGIGAGSYPAFFLSAFQPVQVLKGVVRTRSGRGFRRGLVVFQFVLSVVLIISTMVIYQQYHLLTHKELGFDKEHLVSVPLHLLPDRARNYDLFKQALLQYPRILSVTVSSNKPGVTDHNGLQIRTPGSDKEPLIGIIFVDLDYLKTLGIQLASGRDFSQDIASDAGQAILLNESALQDLGPEFGLGRPVELFYKQQEKAMVFYSGTVIGVVRDFNHRPLYERPQPMVFVIPHPAHAEWTYNQALVRIGPEQVVETTAFIKAQWERLFPELPCHYSFLDQDIEGVYRPVQRWQTLFTCFALLAISVACLGLFGLASFTAEQRTKEIGIRKVLGASVPHIIALLSKEFIWLVIIANALAWPIGYLAMNFLLQDFAYRIELGPGVFVLGGVLALLIAWLTVSYQAIRAARANPVEALRYE